MAITVNRIQQAIAHSLGFSEKEIARAFLPPHLAAEEARRERTATEQDRAAAIAARGALVKRATTELPEIAKATAAAKEQFIGAELAFRVAKHELAAATARQLGASHRLDQLLGHEEWALRALTPDCVPAAIERVEAELNELRRSGPASWDEDKGHAGGGMEWVRKFVRKSNADSHRARLAALVAAREQIRSLVLRCVTDAEMGQEIGKIFESLPALR